MHNSISNIGTCTFCQQTIEHTLMANHFHTCEKKLALEHQAQENLAEDIFLIQLSVDNLYWLLLEANSSASLENLNEFLERNWIECCGRITQVSIQGKNYFADQLNNSMGKLLHIGSAFSYEYQSDVAAHIQGKVLTARKGNLPQGLRLAARKMIADDQRCLSCQETTHGLP